MSAIGSIIGAVGSVLGGLLGSNDDNTLERIQLKRAITLRAEDARNAGIHPLAALGAGWPNYQSTNSNAALGQGVGDAAKIIGNMLDQMMVKENAEADIEEKRAQADLAKAQAFETMKNANAIGRGQAGRTQNFGTPEANSTLAGENLGDPSKFTDLSQIGVLPAGQPQRVANPDTAPDAETSLWAQVEQGTFPKFLRYLSEINTPKEVLELGWKIQSALPGRSIEELKRRYEKEMRILAKEVGRVYHPRFPTYRTGGGF